MFHFLIGFQLVREKSSAASCDKPSKQPMRATVINLIPDLSQKKLTKTFQAWHIKVSHWWIVQLGGNYGVVGQ